MVFLRKKRFLYCWATRLWALNFTTMVGVFSDFEFGVSIWQLYSFLRVWVWCFEVTVAFFLVTMSLYFQQTAIFFVVGEFRISIVTWIFSVTLSSVFLVDNCIFFDVGEFAVSRCQLYYFRHWVSLDFLADSCILFDVGEFGISIWPLYSFRCWLVWCF